MNGTGRAGTRLEFRPAEILNANGAPDQKTTGSPIFDGYTLAGHESESFTLQFMYHGNQYIGVRMKLLPFQLTALWLTMRLTGEYHMGAATI